MYAERRRNARTAPHAGRRRGGRHRHRRDRRAGRRPHGLRLLPVSLPTDPVSIASRRLGISQLYPEQKEIISQVLSHRDVLVILPTGFGKSACYQVPSMVLPSPTVLVSPLLALLHDQEQKLLRKGIPCVRMDSSVRGRKQQEVLGRISAGGPLLVMTTPESLGSPVLIDALRRSGVSLAAIDEAHCISEWGHDFRPSYLRIGAQLRELGSPPLLALTATATERVREDIQRALSLRDPVVICSSPHRGNLELTVKEVRGDERTIQLAKLLRGLRRPGIVYCATTRIVDDLYGALRRLSLPVHRYHGRMTAKERTREQELFMRPGRRTIMIATSAFGLGIDKPDIRYVIHYQAPASLEQYIQEAGRAGRDGRWARCELLFSKSDREIHEALLQRSRVQPEQLFRLARVLAAWAGEKKSPVLEALALSAGLSQRTTSALLAVLEEVELIRYDPAGTITVLAPAETVEQQARALARRFDTVRIQDARRLNSISDYAHSDTCRAVFLRRYFGEPDPKPCGICDICCQRADLPKVHCRRSAA